MKKVAIVFFALILASGYNAFAAELKIGHVDLQKLVANSEAGKYAREQYLARTKQYQDEINIRSEKMKQLKETIDNESKGLKKGDKTPQSLIDKDRDYAAQARELQRLLGTYQEELKVYDAELIRKVVEGFMPILNEYAKKKGYDYIFSRIDVLAYATEKRDLTDILVKEFDARWTK
jgi:outer membrane protein